MELQDKDLNLLVLFVTIWEERNLSRTAERLYLSQPAISHALNRLRNQFDDPLFVRSGRGVVPTDYAVSISQDVFKLIQQTEELFRRGKDFDPELSERTLVLATGDYFASTMLKDFIVAINREAPLVRVVCYPDSELFSPSKFENGEIHLGITGFRVDPKEGFRSKTIIKDRVSCCFRKRHPRGRKQISFESYLEAEHVLVSVIGRTHGIVDEKLKKMKKQRTVSVVVPTFFEAGSLLEQTDLILTAPRGICRHLEKKHDLKVFETPFPKIHFPVSMHWHQRTDADPFHQWVRDLIASKLAPLVGK